MEYLNTKEAADFLKISPCTLYRYVRNREIPFSKRKGRLRFKIEKLEQWVDEGERKPSIILENDFNKVLKGLTNLPPIVIDKEGGQDAVAKAKIKRLNCGFGYIYIRKTSKGKPRFYLEYYNSEGKRKQELDKTVSSWEEGYISLQKSVQREHDKK